jgi:hypothetical protein
LQIATGDKINLSLGAGNLAVVKVIFLVNLALLSDLQTQVFLVVQSLTGHDGFWNEGVGDISLRQKKQKLNDVQDNADCHELWNPLKRETVPSCSATFLHYPAYSFRHVLIGTCQVDHWATWNGLYQGLKRREFAVNVHRRDKKSALKVILVHFLKNLEYLRHNSVREVVNSHVTFLGLCVKKNGILFTKKMLVVRKTSL